MLKLFVVAVIVAAVAADVDSDWAVFKATYNKKYPEGLESIRKGIWLESRKTIQEHNERFRNNQSSYFMGENEYSDMTDTEFFSKMNGMKIHREYQEEDLPKVNIASLPTTVDWRDKGFVTGVKNQGNCGSCWAFSATGSMEGQHFNATGKLVSLSESNLVDCSGPFGNQGCKGGLPDQAFDYVISKKGIDTEASYPYVPETLKCHFNASNVGANISSYQDIATGSEAALQKAVAEVGPISVGIDANHFSFKHYKGGVYDNIFCSKTFLDHGVLVVGYGTYDDKDYWMVKNSWGLSYGIKGYIMMSRNKNNQCGIATAASYPIV